MKVNTIPLGISMSFKTIHHGRLVHELFLTNLEYLLFVALPFPDICTNPFEAWYSLTTYFTWFIKRLNMSIFQLSVVLTSVLKQVTISLENTKEDTASFPISSAFCLRGFYLAAFILPIRSHWKNPALFHATHTFF